MRHRRTESDQDFYIGMVNCHSKEGSATPMVERVVTRDAPEVHPRKEESAQVQGHTPDVMIPRVNNNTTCAPIREIRVDTRERWSHALIINGDTVVVKLDT